MSDTADRYRRLAADFTQRVEAVPDDRWSNQSPCADWTARDVIQHMLDTSTRFLGFIGEKLPPGPSVDEHPLGAWSNARDAMQSALDDPERATREFDGMWGPSTFEAGVNRFICADLVIHAWDLSRATGIDERLDPADVHEVYETLRTLGDKLRGPGAFGPAVDPPPGADEQAELLAFLGRTV